MKFLDNINKVSTTLIKKIKKTNMQTIEFIMTYYKTYRLNKQYDGIVHICNSRPEEINRSVYNLLTNAEMINKRELLRNKKLSKEDTLIFIEELKEISLFNKRIHIGYTVSEAGSLVGKECTKEEELKYREYVKHISVGLEIDIKSAEKFCVGVFKIEDYLEGLL